MIRVININEDNFISLDRACNTYCLRRFLVKKNGNECFIVLERKNNPEKNIYYLVSNVTHEVKRHICMPSVRLVIKSLLSEGYEIYVDDED